MEPSSIIYFRKNGLSALTPQSVIFGFTDVLSQNYLLLLIFKYNVYNSRLNTLSFQSPKRAISQMKYIEQTISKNDLNKKNKNSK